MNILDIKLKAKSVGISTLVFSTLIALFAILISIFLILMGIKSGIGLPALIPFILLSFSVLVLSAGGVYIGIRYIKGRVFKSNRNLGLLLIILGTGTFIYTLISFLFSNLTGNTGGWLQPVITLFWAIISVPVGLTLKNGCR